MLSFARMSRVFLLLSFLSCPQFSKAGTQGWERLGCKPDAWTVVPEQERASSSRFASTKGMLCTTLSPCPPHDKSTLAFLYSLYFI